MSITTILFDLDGTLLPMDQDEFVRAYFKLLAKKLAGHGYDPEALLGNIWAGVEAMVKNTGECNNEEAFWRTFDKIYGEEVRNMERRSRSLEEQSTQGIYRFMCADGIKSRELQ